MNLYQTMQKFLLDKNYYLDIWDTYIHVYNFIDIETLNEKLIVLNMENFKLEITGEDFRVLKLTKKEILIEGILNNVRINR